MNTEFREIYFDKELQLEAYYFDGVSQKFPNHFHDYYVIGFIISGKRNLICNGGEYTTQAGDFLLFNPFDSHGCTQIDEDTLTYRALNISIERMKELIEAITGKKELLKFKQPVLNLPRINELFLNLHQLILEKQDDFNKEELLYFLIDALLLSDADDTKEETIISTDQDNLLKAKQFIENQFATIISLEELAKLCHMSKFTLIRQFTKHFGVTPYQYLQTIRIKESKKWLSSGEELSTVSFKVGFSDQSHFSRVFKSLIGITPKQYQEIFR